MKNKKMLSEIFDSLFIMILCFGTLFTAMELRGKTIGQLKYTLNFATLALTVISLGICLYFIISNSEKGLKYIVRELYDNELLEDVN